MTVIRRPVWIGCLLLLGCGAVIRLTQEGVALWERLRDQRDQLQAKLARLEGWVVVSPEVAAQVREVFGESRDSPHLVVERLSRQAAAVGAHITELKPRADGLELGVEGPAAPLAAYLQGLALHRPPLALESVSVLSQPRESAPILMRVRVRMVPTGEIP